MYPIILQSLSEFEELKINLINKKYQVQLCLRNIFAKILLKKFASKSTLQQESALINSFKILEKTVMDNINQTLLDRFESPSFIDKIKNYLETSELSHLVDIS